MLLLWTPDTGRRPFLMVKLGQKELLTYVPAHKPQGPWLG